MARADRAAEMICFRRRASLRFDLFRICVIGSIHHFPFMAKERFGFKVLARDYGTCFITSFSFATEKSLDRQNLITSCSKC